MCNQGYEVAWKLGFIDDLGLIRFSVSLFNHVKVDIVVGVERFILILEIIITRGSN